jgi:N-acetylglucosaminyldiphosphoundecaprenol N-acetyl-beta-D-mannosaminyltransferase
VSLIGIPICRITEQQCIDRILAGVRAGRGGWVVTPNLDHLRRCAAEPDYATLILDADLRVADGMPLVWAGRLAGTPLPGRVAGSDLIFSLSRALGGRRRSIYLLGGNPGTAEAAAAVLRRSCPGLIIAGTACPSPGFENDPRQVEALREDLEASAPDVVFVALGSPKQERLIRRLLPVVPRAWWLGVGISFSFVCGEVSRAPHWMQRCGLEWLHRLAKEPRRLARRYLIDGLPFAVRLLACALRSRIRKGRRPGTAC